MKILTGSQYTLPRLVGIKAEMWAAVTGKEPPITDTQFAQGFIVTNSISSEVGLLLDEKLEYFDKLPSIHAERLVDVEEDDGWIPTPQMI